MMTRGPFLVMGVLLTGITAGPTLAPVACGAIYAETHFDSGLEGWTAVGDGSINWQSTGGNPGGYLQAIDPAHGPNTDAEAPGEFLGNWSAGNGSGSLSADLIIISGGAVKPGDGAQFLISGPAGTAYVHFPDDEPPLHNEWRTFTVPLVESAWTRELIQDATWVDLLSDVRKLWIDVEHIDGPETTGLDNVVLIPEPGTVLLLAFGGLAILRKRGR